MANPTNTPQLLLLKTSIKTYYVILVLLLPSHAIISPGIDIQSKITSIKENYFIVYRTPSLGITTINILLEHSKYWMGSGDVYAYVATGKDCIEPPSDQVIFKKKSQFKIEPFSFLSVKDYKQFVAFGFSPVCVVFYCVNKFSSCDMLLSLQIITGLSIKETQTPVPLYSKSFVVEGTGFRESTVKDGLECRAGSVFIDCYVLFIINENKMRVGTRTPINFKGGLYFTVKKSGWAPMQVGVIKKAHINYQVSDKLFVFFAIILLTLIVLSVYRKISKNIRYKKQLNQYYNKFQSK